MTTGQKFSKLVYIAEISLWESGSEDLKSDVETSVRMSLQSSGGETELELGRQHCEGGWGHSICSKGQVRRMCMRFTQATIQSHTV